MTLTLKPFEKENAAGSLKFEDGIYVLTLTAERLGDDKASNSERDYDAVKALTGALVQNMREQKQYTPENQPKIIVHLKNTQMLSGAPLGELLKTPSLLTRFVGPIKPTLVADTEAGKQIFNPKAATSAIFNIKPSLEAAKEAFMQPATPTSRHQS